MARITGGNFEGAQREDAASDGAGRAALDGIEVDQNFITGVYYPYAIAIQGQHLYWSG